MASRRLSIVWLAAAAVVSGSAGLEQEQEIRTERIEFEAGATGTRIQGSITGYGIVDYRLGARAGQTMVVNMTTSSGANYFNVLAPGETEVAFFNGSINANAYAGRLSESGDYTIRVYQMRSAARRQETARYTLNVEITSADHEERGNVEAQPPTDALVPGTGFHATGNIPCARWAGQPMGSCLFGVVREGDGSGTVRFRFSHGILTLSGNTGDEDACVKAIQRWLASVAKREFSPRLAELSALTGLSYSRMHVRMQRSCWGSRSSSGTISLNLCLLFVAPELLRYLLIHELSHGRHMNHSKRFWQLVGRHEPRYRKLDRQLGEAWKVVPPWLGIY